MIYFEVTGSGMLILLIVTVPADHPKVVLYCVRFVCAIQTVRQNTEAEWKLLVVAQRMCKMTFTNAREGGTLMVKNTQKNSGTEEGRVVTWVGAPDGTLSVKMGIHKRVVPQSSLAQNIHIHI